jgi:sarcosine oxidase, subunit delta
MVISSMRRPLLLWPTDMLLVPCPYCGDRAEIEFSYGGEAHVVRSEDPSTVDDEKWSEFLYFRSNPKGPHAERWRHVHGCGRFFNVIRDTRTDAILACYKIGATEPDLGNSQSKGRE